MSKNRGFHNYMQRRAQFRSPGPPPRVRAGGRAGRGVYAKRSFKVSPPPYEHRHRRPIDLKHLQALIERQHRLSRALDRARRSWERLLGREDLFSYFSASPERMRASRRRDRRFPDTTTTGDVGLPRLRVTLPVSISNNRSDTAITIPSQPITTTTNTFP